LKRLQLQNPRFPRKKNKKRKRMQNLKCLPAPDPRFVTWPLVTIYFTSLLKQAKTYPSMEKIRLIHWSRFYLPVQINKPLPNPKSQGPLRLSGTSIFS
jgi:hypothetical protein